MKPSLEYQVRAVKQRLLGIDAQLDARWTFRGVADRYDALSDLRRLERALKRESARNIIAFDAQEDFSSVQA